MHSKLACRFSLASQLSRYLCRASHEYRDFTLAICTDANGRKHSFAVDDVHGCVDQLKELLAEVTDQSASVEKSTLVFLGDLINRGPDSLGALSEWASEKHDQKQNVVHRLFGNYEQLMMIVAHRLRGDEEAEAKFLEVGGNAFMQELQSVLSGLPVTLSA